MMSVGRISREDVVSVANDFWVAMAAVPIAEVAALPAVKSDEEGVLGHVEIRGAWKGMVEIRASRSLSLATASALLGKPSSQVSIEECFDAIQEATNIVAGSIKRLLPPICKLANPAISSCGNFGPIPHNAQMLAVSFISSPGMLTILVAKED